MPNAKKIVTKSASKNSTSDGHGYLTKRITVSRARAAGKNASIKAMKVMGYIVVAQGDSIIKKYKDGREEVISKI